MQGAPVVLGQLGVQSNTPHFYLLAGAGGRVSSSQVSERSGVEWTAPIRYHEGNLLITVKGYGLDRIVMNAAHCEDKW
jgi:hypothetical protein